MATVVYLVVVLSWCVFVLCHGSVTTSPFTKEPVICDVTERVVRGCSSHIPGVRSGLECVTRCGSVKACIGASLDQGGQCFHHRECPVMVGVCVSQDNDHRYLAKYCVHGTWDVVTQSCSCVDGFHGNRCNQCYRRCRDLLSANYGPGFHRVYIDPEHEGQMPFMVECYLSLPDYASVRLFQNKGVHDFNKTWADYVNGFYHDADNTWVGLYPMHRITNAGQSEIVFVIEFLSRTDIPALYRTYLGVSVSDESNQFRFTFTTSSVSVRGDVPQGSTFGDCLEPLQDVPFSSWDNDNDIDLGINCAWVAGSGWWYEGCDNPCNALGYGLQDWNSRPREQIMSLLGLDMELIVTENILFYMYSPDNLP